jgi:hypothetical protein
MREPKDCHLALLVPSTLRAALDLAAARRFQTTSEFVRQSIVEQMRRDGVEPTSIERATA